MRIAPLLAELPQEHLERLAAEHLGSDHVASHAATCNTLEGVLRSFAFVRQFVVNRQPPAFSILTTLLDAEGFAVPLAAFRERVEAQTADLARKVGSGEILGRDDQLRLYRRVLAEARRSDLEIDPSEAAILGVLRRELGISAVEHFLIEHHPDFHEFWKTEHCFLHELNALRSAGLVFAHEGNLLLPEEVGPLVRQALGIEVSWSSARRLFEQLSGQELVDALAAAQLRTSGSKDEKLERLLDNWVQPSAVARSLGIATLREMCRAAGALVSGSKEELVERLVDHFGRGLDQQQAPSEAPPPPPPEPRALDERRFRALFSQLKGTELTAILTDIGARSYGTKDAKVTTLFQSPLAETSLLGTLTNKDIEDVLARLRLKTSGAKRERVDRIVEHFRTMPDVLLTQVTDDAPWSTATPPVAPSDPGSTPSPDDAT